MNKTIGADSTAGARTGYLSERPGRTRLRQEGKRETGENPVRSRHCKRGAKANSGHWPEGREGSMDAMIRKPGNLPVVDTGKPGRSGSPGHGDLAVSKECCAAALLIREL